MMSGIGSETPDGPHRRERAAIAAQACQTCRNRKTKCDEQRPKCGLCRRLHVDCEYREPLPTKKDKTMVHILDALTRLENKFDNLAMTGGSPSEYTPNTNSPGVRTSVSGASSSHASIRNSNSRTPRFSPKNDLLSNSTAESDQTRAHVTLPHEVLLWPSIYLYLVNSSVQTASDLQHILREGTTWFVRQEFVKHLKSLPADVGLPSFPINVANHNTDRKPNVAFPTLSVQQLQEYADAYFNTFNVLYPLLNRDTFMNETMSTVLREGYGDGDTGSILALLVFALGQVAVEGVFDRPIIITDRQQSGFRGGTATEPPGLAIFNEARRRLGFVASENSLESVQIQLLQAIYYESCARHLDFWRSTVAASVACQVLIRCGVVDWTTPESDLIKRAYWTCVLNEDLFHLDLDLPQSGIQTLEDDVPLPYFHQAHGSHEQQGINEERSHFQYHFLAMIALRRLIARIHAVIHESFATQGESSEDYNGPSNTVLREIVRQLDSWRALLPRPLQWSDNDPNDFPSTEPASRRRPNEVLFLPDQGTIPIGHRYNLDIVTAQLRTRFHYARFMVNRPLIYKALHFPELMTADDANHCATALRSACMWPLALAPPKNKKRLVPHLYAWTQNFLGILLIFRMTVENECLRRICDEHVDRDEIERSAALMLDWISDVRHLDGVAEWSWRILEPLYRPGQSLR